jgi:hypothetical protein
MATASYYEDFAALHKTNLIEFLISRDQSFHDDGARIPSRDRSDRNSAVETMALPPLQACFHQSFSLVQEEIA